MDTHTRTDAIDLGPACARTARVAEGVRDEQLDGPTPCPDYSVRTLLAHVAGLATGLAATARKDFGPLTDTAPGAGLPELGARWRGDLERLLGELAEAWRDPAAWQGQSRAGSVDLPGAVGGVVALNEVLLHGWDLARATGQRYVPGGAGLSVSYAALDAGVRGDAPRGPFGPPVPVAEDAPLLDRVVGLSGRDPGWTPGR
ncbi:TIGR03086 family metal-binding protein [Streptomyces sp. 8L]|uniref:TIGR03086 family metal-binding protein n=1 Tax=Streptomyces sp. 8L TaxID=2877242 RepID=UPI001CD713F2|nr:TIGR03086 family metal-binding protein [Streptomyces sp. 8L]MCA1220160.1 TIGR03086 family protein [Streptomyces sp. 8L]